MWRATAIAATTTIIATNLCALSKDVTAVEVGVTIPAIHTTAVAPIAARVSRHRPTLCPTTAAGMLLLVSMRTTECPDVVVRLTAAAVTTAANRRTIMATLVPTTADVAVTRPRVQIIMEVETPVIRPVVAEVLRNRRIVVEVRRITTLEATRVREALLIVPLLSRNVAHRLLQA